MLVMSIKQVKSNVFSFLKPELNLRNQKGDRAEHVEAEYQLIPIRRHLAYVTSSGVGIIQ